MSSTKAICTIVAKNYIAFARTMAQSFLALHPDCKCYVLIIDEFDGYINPADECFEIVRLEELRIPQLRPFCFKYNITELSTAVKASLLEYLIREKSVGRLLYIDPDILITSELNDLFEKLNTYDIVLTPHLDRDYPEDNLLPNDGYVLRSGVFNLGFIGINSSENSLKFLEWWKPKLYDRCVDDMLNGYFVDQRFIDLVPVLFKNFHIVTDPGYNVAYWNLHSRAVSPDERNGAKWKCNDGPLHFFHFSGYRPEDPNTLVNYIPHHLRRHRLSEMPRLQPLFAEYRCLLMDNGYESTRSWPYTFGTFRTGEPIPKELRVWYRKSPEQWSKYGDPFESSQLKRRAAVINLSKKQYLSLVARLARKCRIVDF